MDEDIYDVDEMYDMDRDYEMRIDEDLIVLIDEDQDSD